MNFTLSPFHIPHEASALCGCSFTSNPLSTAMKKSKTQKNYIYKLHTHILLDIPFVNSFNFVLMNKLRLTCRIIVMTSFSLHLFSSGFQPCVKSSAGRLRKQFISLWAMESHCGIRWSYVGNEGGPWCRLQSFLLSLLGEMYFILKKKKKTWPGKAWWVRMQFHLHSHVQK